MNDDQAVQVFEAEEKPLSVLDLQNQVQLIQTIMKGVMKDGEHYGKIPGCGDKPALLKAGAEKLNLTFRMNPDPIVEVLDLGNGHREYRVKCIMYSIVTGKRLGAGVGSANTMETKWRYRTGPVEFTDRPVPKEYWDERKSNPDKALALLGGKGFITAKNDAGAWMIARRGERVEHDNPADYYNTCEKMAKKRALVDAVLTVTGASDIFTQDIEEMPPAGDLPGHDQTKAGQKQSASSTNKTEGVKSPKDPTAPISEPQKKMIFALLAKSTLSEDTFKEHFGLEHITELQMGEMNKALAFIQEHTKAAASADRQPGEEG